MQDTLNQNIHLLTQLLSDSQKKKLLWEEMQIISHKAFELETLIMAELDQIEATETDITKIQAAFGAREQIWDIMEQIAARELELKEKTYRKETPEERQKRHQEAMEPEEDHHQCCCGHHHAHTHECTCRHEEAECCCQTEKKSCRKK